MPAPTRADLLAAADASDAEAEKKELEAALMRNQARGLRELAARVIGESVLTTRDSLSTLDTVNASPSSNALRSQGQLDANPGHKFVAMLKAKRLTVPKVATFLTEKLGRPVPRNTVQSWYKKPGDPGFRRIPHDAAEAIRDRYGVPMGSWHNRRPPEE